MGNKNLARVSRVLLVLLLVAVVACSAFGLPQAIASGEGQSSGIVKLEDLEVDYTDYLDASKVYQLPDTVADHEEISVIITLNVDNLMDTYALTDRAESFTDYALFSEDASRINGQVISEKARILELLDEKGISYTTGGEYSTILSGFEIVIRAGDFAAVCQSLGDGEGTIVSEVYEAAEAQLVENTVNIDTNTGIFDTAMSGYDGTGMVVAVLDTGLDYNHSAFSVDNFTSTDLGLTYEQVAAVIGDTLAYEQSGGLTVDDVYISEKVPFGYDYADNDPDVYSTHNNHGTHVSGVIVGKDDTITGVAPNAQLVSMKTFSDIMDTARSSWILSALEDCVILDVDVINMSLGTACGFARETDEEAMSGVYDKIRAAGISVVVAASNSYSSAYASDANGNLGLTSNPDTGTVGSPGTYDGVLSVASINGEETPYIKHGETIIYFDESTNSFSKENDFFETLLGDTQSKEFDYVIIPGVGRSADYTGVDVTGKIVLVRRGDNTFEEKATIAQNQGAAGIIIYNNVSGEIKMNVGAAAIAVCSISQDDGEMLVAAGNGKLTISKDQTSGPFISEFSSWGPTPSLNIKPEITGHGGNILSSVTGGGYDRLSGTSMACPNVSGLVLLLRQYVTENFPAIADDNLKVSAMVNCLMMSTADIASNTNGLPYAVRKQGAGLANLMSAINTTAYITTYDADGNAMDKTKLELGDDPNKTGVYTLKFTVNNFGTTSLTYDVGAYVLTEGVSDIKTNAGKTTVTEAAYSLSGATLSVSCTSGGTLAGTSLTVPGGSNADVTVTITLSDADKQYLNTSFANGMYVEGYVTLTATAGTEIDLNVPYLAFYGDWTQAPLFDLTFFDTNKDELDDAIDEEDKTKADAYATRAIGGLYDDYVSYLGSYYFLQDPDDMVIAANENYIALSNKEGTVHSLRFVWAGLLRNAERIEIVITNDATGEVIFETVDTDVRKSYGDGGSIYPANIEIEFDTIDYNLANNSKYTVTLTGYLDYGEDGGIDTNTKNVFQFPLTVDFEAPSVTDVEYYSEYDQTNKMNRLYAKVSVYDNHYAMCAQMGYVTVGTDSDGNEIAELKAFEQYMTPIYSKENSTTVVTLELTDYLFNIKEGAINKNTFVLTCYDYAMNYATYELELPDSFVDFYYEGVEDGLTISTNEVITLSPTVEGGWAELLEFSSNKPSVARVVNNKLVGTAPGKAIVKIMDPSSGKSQTIQVTVLGEGDEGYQRYDQPVADVFYVSGYTTQKAYFMINSSDKEIGDTGDVRFFEGDYSLSLYPSESVLVNYDLDAFFPSSTTVSFESSNENVVTVDSYGTITARAEGFASITMKVLLNGNSTYYSQSISIEVKDPFVNSGASLTHYYGLGGVVSFPADLDVNEIGNFAFANYDYVLKTEEELAFDDAETSKQWYIGDSTITKVILPEGIEKIGAYAFANLTALEEIVLPSTLTAIEYGAFYGCTSLTKVTFSGENNLQIISQSAFELCNLKSIDLSSICVISAYAFAGNQNMTSVITGDDLISVGDYAFASCQKLSEITITASKVKYGTYVFNGCDALTSFTVNAAVLGEGMFNECENLESVTVGADVKDIGEFAFRKTKVSSITVAEGNTAFKVQTAPYVLSADGTTLVAVGAGLSGTFSTETLGGVQVTAIGDGAFSHNNAITAVVLPGVTKIGAYGMGSSTKISQVTLGTLTYIDEYAFFETRLAELPQFTADAYIGRYAFSHTNLTSVTLPDNAVVAEGVFSQCKDLESVTVGNNVTLGDYAFYMDKDSSFTVSHYDEDDERYFYYTFASKLTSLTVGDNVLMGKSAFSGHASLEAVTLGANAQIGEMAFYNCDSLKDIDLSKVSVIGNYAFSGDVYYICLDDSMTVAAISKDGYYMYTYHAPDITYADLTGATQVGEYAFSYCREMTGVKLGSGITEIAPFTFAGCMALKDIDLSKVTAIGENAFIENQALVSVDLSSAERVGDYAFVYARALTSVKLSPAGTELGEGTFSYCEKLTSVSGLEASPYVGDYTFAYTALTSADLTAAEYIGTHAFLKETPTAFTVKLGTSLTELGDNPFAMCQVEPFVVEKHTVVEPETTEPAAEAADPVVETERLSGTYDISDTVCVIDGSLYYRVPNGLEMITFAGDADRVTVADDTVRIGAMAFAGSDIHLVELPVALEAIGHKAFYGCEKLEIVYFGSYNAPVLEEEFDASYYESLEHIPGTGDFGTYTDYAGNDVTITGMGLLPYYMWNVTDSMYSNTFYGANFVDYVGYVEDKLIMIRPVNGQNYETFILNQYFSTVLDGSTAPTEETLAAIKAIDAIPDRVTYEQRAIVEEARAAYNKIATLDQQALVTNYTDLISAEQRVEALKPGTEGTEGTDNAVEQTPEAQEQEMDTAILLIVGFVVLVVAGVISARYLIKTRKKSRKDGEAVADAETGDDTVAAEAADLPETTVRVEADAIIGDVSLMETPEEEAGEPAVTEEAEAAGTEETEPAEEAPEQAEAEEETEAEPEAEAEAEETEEAEAEETEEAEAEETEEAEAESEAESGKKRINWGLILKIGVWVAAAAILLFGILNLSSCLAEPTPYEVNNADGYTVSVKFDANGGLFTTNTAVFVDSYNVSSLTPGIDGTVSLPVMAPDNAGRGLDSYTAVNNGYFLVGWYTQRTENTAADGSTYYTYSGQWNFDSDRLTVDTTKEYSAEEPVMTLYAYWLPLFKYEFYTVGSDELLSEYSVDPRSESALQLPAWNEDTGAMSMGQFPIRAGYTFEALYLDKEGTQKVEGETVAHSGQIDPITGEAQGQTMKLYIGWTEGSWYKISTADQLIANANPAGCYEILADLDFSGKNWPQNLMYNNFSGKIIGNGHTLRSITVEITSGDRGNAGLFGQISETAQMSDVTFEDLTVNFNTNVTKSLNVGVFAGFVSDKAVLTNVAVTGGKLCMVKEDAYFLPSADVAIGLVCAVGDPALVTEEITLEGEGWYVDSHGMVLQSDASEETPVPDQSEAVTEPVTEDGTEGTGAVSGDTAVTEEVTDGSTETEEVTGAAEDPVEGTTEADPA